MVEKLKDRCLITKLPSYPFLKDVSQIVTAVSQAHMSTQEVLRFTKCNVHPVFNNSQAAN